MVPLRQALIVEEHGTLPFPEGTACAEVLLAGEEGGSKAGTVFKGLGLAAAYKFIADGLKVFPSEIGYAFKGYADRNPGPAVSGRSRIYLRTEDRQLHVRRRYLKLVRTDAAYRLVRRRCCHLPGNRSDFFYGARRSVGQLY